jgi:cell division protein FtsW
MFDRTDRSHIGVWWWTVDKMMLASIFLLMVLGAVLVMAASPPVASRIGLPEQHFVWKQLIFLMPATAIMLTTSILSARLIRILCLLGLVFISSLMIATVLIGPEVKGATRWLTIGGFRLQPSEFIKPLCAVSCAWLLGLWRERDQFPGWIWASAIASFVTILLMLQPDIGMTSVVLLTFGFQLFLAGLPLLLVFAAIGLAPLVGWLAYSHFAHVQQRIDKFLGGGGMQTERSIQSFTEGGWFGVGPGDGTVKQYLPDAHADFIFSVAAEEYGLMACLLLIGAYSFVVLRGYAQSLNRPDMFTILAVSGLTTQFGVQAAIHMASSVDMIPTKGMTLPLISYGGSSLLASGLTLGLILALTRKRLHSAPPFTYPPVKENI